MKKLKGCYNYPTIIGCDTETGDDKPLMLQFYNGDNATVYNVDEESITDRFFDYLYSLPRGNYVLFFHNLGFDIPMIFYRYMERLTEEKLNIKYNGFKIDIIYGKCKFGRIKNDSKRFELLDSYQFFNRSLYALSRIFNLDHKKLETPENIGIGRKITDEMRKYAIEDAKTEFDLAKYIMDRHKEYDIPQTVSIAQFASKIFKKHFLKDALIRLPSKSCIDSCVKSYHGGLNVFTLDKPEIIRGVFELDINSAYPDAMCQIPNFNNAGIINVNDFDGGEGIYCVSGYAEKTIYPILFDHGFKPYSGEFVYKKWVTSYELEEAVRTGDFIIEDCYGYVIDSNKNDYNPLKSYVDEFYNLKKETPKDHPLYMFYKTLLNSLYGKFIQGVPLDGFSRSFAMDVDNWKLHEVEAEFRAGGLFHPFIATLITGYVRAKLRQFALKYRAIDTSTDSIKTVLKPHRKDLGNELGDWSIDNYGPCLFVRNKLYVHFGDKMKYALHGFRGNIKDLIRMYYNKETEYNYTHLYKIKESYISKSDIVPMSFRERRSNLNIEWD